MTTPKFQSLSKLALRGLQSGKGSMKLMAALGELLAADTMVNLCSAVDIWYGDAYSDADRERINEVDMRVHLQVNEAFAAFEAATDVRAATAQLIPVLLSATKELRELLKGVDFYDDAVVSPYRPSGHPGVSKEVLPAPLVGITHVCARCGVAVKAHVRQKASEAGVRWSMSFSCPHCGNRFEADGGQPIPSDIRTAILEQDGAWSLRVDASGQQLVTALATLRAVMGLSIDEASQLKQRIPGQVAQGTRAEMYYLHCLLRLKGVVTRVERLEPVLRQP